MYRFCLASGDEGLRGFKNPDINYLPMIFIILTLNLLVNKHHASQY